MLSQPSLPNTASARSIPHPRESTTSSPALRLWAWPLALGLLSASGLLSALVSDGWGDVWSWLGLGVPLLVTGWFGLRRQPASPQKS